MEEIAKRIAGLSPQKRLLLEKLMESEGGAAVESLARLVQASAAREESPLVLLRSGAGRPLFCVHPAGGGVLCYSGLARRLAGGQPFYAFQAAPPAGLSSGGGEIERLAADYIEAMRGVQAEGPYLLAGWSAGGVIAFEMARQLRARGERLDLLALIDSKLVSPEDREWLKTAESEKASARLLISFALDLGLARKNIMDLPDRMRGLTEDERLSYVLERAKAAGLVPEGAELDEIRRSFNIFRSIMLALCSYEPEPVDIRVTLLKASGTGAEPDRADEAMGWGSLALGGVEMREVPGTHYSIVREPQVSVLASALTACLSRAQRSIEDQGDQVGSG